MHVEDIGNARRELQERVFGIRLCCACGAKENLEVSKTVRDYCIAPEGRIAKADGEPTPKKG